MKGSASNQSAYIIHPTSLFHFPNHDDDDGQEDEEVAAEDEEDMGVIETYSNYKPSKLKVNPVLKLFFFYFPK